MQATEPRIETESPFPEARECQSGPFLVHKAVEAQEPPAITVIIPDIHNKVARVTEITQRARACPASQVRFVCLGDYFDDFQESLENIAAVICWLKTKLHDPNWTFLTGNHDMPYRFPKVPKFQCSGFTRVKSLLINSELDKRDWAQLKAFYWLDNFLLSHAGVDGRFMSKAHAKEELPFVLEEIDEEISVGRVSPYTAAGRDRGGSAPWGGITWADFRFIEPIIGVSQIVGHTASKHVRAKENMLCLDTHLNHYAEYDHKTRILSIKEF